MLSVEPVDIFIINIVSIMVSMVCPWISPFCKNVKISYFYSQVGARPVV